MHDYPSACELAMLGLASSENIKNGTDCSVTARKLPVHGQVRPLMLLFLAIVQHACNGRVTVVFAPTQAPTTHNSLLRPRSVRSAECEVAVASGVALKLMPQNTISMASAGMLSVDGRSKTLDARANGFAKSEGVGSVVLYPEVDADSLLGTSAVLARCAARLGTGRRIQRMDWQHSSLDPRRMH